MLKSVGLCNPPINGENTRISYSEEDDVLLYIESINPRSNTNSLNQSHNEKGLFCSSKCFFVSYTG
jgi:hypothetical protein